MWSVHVAHPKFCNAPRPSPGRCFWHLPPLPARTRLEPARTPGDCVRLDAVPRADIGLGRAAGSLSGVAAAGPHGRGTRPRGVARARTTLLRVAQEGGGAKEHGHGLTLGMPVRLVCCSCRLFSHRAVAARITQPRERPHRQQADNCLVTAAHRRIRGCGSGKNSYCVSHGVETESRRRN